jgi:hypothetical protein
MAQPKRLTSAMRPLGPDWTLGKATATGGADIVQNGLNALGAIGALIGTDARVFGVRRQILVAPLAIRSKFQHGSPGKKGRIPDQNLS